MWVGYATAYTILGERVAPLFMDWYLAHITDEQRTRRGSNVFDPRDQHHDAGGGTVRSTTPPTTATRGWGLRCTDAP
jgi:hypothetical protein